MCFVHIQYIRRIRATRFTMFMKCTKCSWFTIINSWLKSMAWNGRAGWRSNRHIYTKCENYDVASRILARLRLAFDHRCLCVWMICALVFFESSCAIQHNQNKLRKLQVRARARASHHTTKERCWRINNEYVRSFAHCTWYFIVFFFCLVPPIFQLHFEFGWRDTEKQKSKLYWRERWKTCSFICATWMIHTDLALCKPPSRRAIWQSFQSQSILDYIYFLLISINSILILFACSRTWPAQVPWLLLQQFLCASLSSLRRERLYMCLYILLVHARFIYDRNNWLRQRRLRIAFASQLIWTASSVCNTHRIIRQAAANINKKMRRCRTIIEHGQ